MFRSSVTEDFQAKMIAELAQLEADIVKMKEMEIKSEVKLHNTCSEISFMLVDYHALE